VTKLTTQEPAVADDWHEINLLMELARLDANSIDTKKAQRLVEEPSLSWGTFLELAAAHRVLALVTRNAELHGLLRRSPLWQVMKATRVFTQVRNESLAREFAVIARALDQAKVPFAPRKGLYLADHAYRDIGVRDMSDFDLLIEAAAVGEATAALADIGYATGLLSPNGRVLSPLPRATEVYWRTSMSTVPTLKKLTTDPFAIFFQIDARTDLFEPGSGSSVPAVHLINDARPGRIAGTDARVLTDPWATVDVAVHLHREATSLYCISNGRDLSLSKFLDLSALVAKLDVANCQTVVEIAHQHHIEEPIYYALHHTELVFPGSVPATLLDRLRPANLHFLDEYGAGDHHVATWDSPFLARLFDSSRRFRIQGRSSVPRIT
jgi:hypothetical protein